MLAQARLSAYARELGEEPEVLATYTGRDLLGTRYLPPFPYFMDAPNAFRVLPADFVSTEDGTGIVHMSPAYGEDDMATTQAAGIAAVTPVDSKGRFDETVPDYAGQHVFDANPQIIRDLKNQGRLGGRQRRGAAAPRDLRALLPALLALPKPADLPGGVVVVRQGHRVPRPDGRTQPADHLVSRARQGRPVRQVAVQARGTGRSRETATGARPIPVWKSDDPAYPRIDVYGSLDELERDFGVRPTNLHRPYIDELTRPNPDDPTGQVDDAAHRGRVRRVVRLGVDAVRAGALSVRERRLVPVWRRRRPGHFPGDFIVEYIGQTRGWFYTLHVLATALFDRPAFKTCVAHGIVLGNDGQKMSKSLRNYPDVTEVFDRDGSDAMRWFLMASPILRGGNLIVTEQGIREGVRQVLLPLWNAYTLPRAVRARRRAPGAPIRRTCSTATSWPSSPSCAMT